MTFIRPPGSEFPAPGLTSVTRLVPAAVPSLFHTSDPNDGSEALKYRVPLTFVRSPGSMPSLSGVMSLIRFVPDAVPSLFHSSVLPAASVAMKNSVPLTAVKSWGFELGTPPAMSRSARTTGSEPAGTASTALATTSSVTRHRAAPRSRRERSGSEHRSRRIAPSLERPPNRHRGHAPRSLLIAGITAGSAEAERTGGTVSNAAAPTQPVKREAGDRGHGGGG